MKKTEIINDAKSLWESGFPEYPWDTEGSRYTAYLLRNLEDEINEEDFAKSLLSLSEKMYKADGHVYIDGIDSARYLLFVNEMASKYIGDSNV